MKNNISITEDGYAIIGSSGTGGSYMTFQIVDLNTETTLATGLQISTPGITRADYFGVHGKYNATETENAYIVVASNAGNVVKIPMVAGELKQDNVDIQTSTYATVAAQGTSTIALPNTDGSGIYILARSIARGFYSFEDKSFTAIDGGLIPVGANSGGVYFEIADKKYLAVATDNVSTFTILDITEGAAAAKEIVKSESLLGSHDVKASSAMTPMTVQVLPDAAIIYVYSTNNGIAAYKFTPEKPVQKIVEDPVFNPEAGAFDDEVVVEITCATEGAKIYYTIDGTDPTEASTLYEGAITLTKATTIKAIAVAEGYTSSAIVSAAYDVVTGIEEGNMAKTKVSGLNGALVVETENVGVVVEVYNLQGQKIERIIATGNNGITLSSGVYIVKVGNEVFKRIVE